MNDTARAVADACDAKEWMRLARRGEFAAAWAISDRIGARSKGARDWTLPRNCQQVWDGSSFAGRHVLIRCYHGLGDTIQFIRYAPMVRAVARRVTVWAQPALVPLLEQMPAIDALLPLHDGHPQIEHDVDIEVMELPYAFRSTLATIPTCVPYVDADPQPLRAPSPRVGIVWRAGDWDRRRNLPFERLIPLLDDPAFAWYSLQLGAPPGETHRHLRTVDVSTVLATARVMRSLDLVISVDSMPAHLAGALGVPVWTLLPADADWRWMEHRPDSPWYPTMTLFRQDGDAGWTDVIARVRHELARVPALRLRACHSG
jgi:hypothetical protein